MDEDEGLQNGSACQHLSEHLSGVPLRHFLRLAITYPFDFPQGFDELPLNGGQGGAETSTMLFTLTPFRHRTFCFPWTLTKHLTTWFSDGLQGFDELHVDEDEEEDGEGQGP